MYDLELITENSVEAKNIELEKVCDPHDVMCNPYTYSCLPE